MKRKLFFDTSVLVAALVREHPHHAAATTLLNDAFGKREPSFVSAHGLAELYAVLTRAPKPLSIHPSDAWQMIEKGILPHVKVVSLSSDEYRSVVEECGRQNWAGGLIYDLLHLRAAAKSSCARIYTFNVKHFRSIAPAGLKEKILMP